MTWKRLSRKTARIRTLKGSRLSWIDRILFALPSGRPPPPPQVLHQILSGFVWEEEALKRAKQSFLQSHETLIKSLEGRSTEMLMERMSGADSRFMSIPQEDIEVRHYRI